MKFFLLALLSLLVTSCSSIIPEQENSALSEINDLKLYFSRASSDSVDFEQYVLKNGVIFAECGSILRGRHKANQQNVISLSKEQQQKINLLAGKVLASSEESILLLSKPGENAHMFDPGNFTLELEKRSFATSLDEITSGTASTAKKLVALSKQIRTYNQNHLCGLKDFYGLGLVK